MPYNTAICIQNLGMIAAVDGDAAKAARLLGFANHAYQELEIQREPTEAMIFERLTRRLQAELADPQTSALRAEGAAMTEEQALELALSG